MSRIHLVLAAALALALVSHGVTASTAEPLTLTVFADGYLHVGQSFPVDANNTSVAVPLLSSVVSDLVASDQNGSPLSYEVGTGGGNITVYTLGATKVTLTYDTNSLTSKNGSVWTLSFEARYNSTVLFPQLSTLTSVSGTPYAVEENGTSPELTLPPGTWKISYGVSLGSVTGTSSSGGEPQTGTPAGSLLPIEVTAAAFALAVAGLFLLRLLRRRSQLGATNGLRPDDVQVLKFIQEKGGRVLEPEIRVRFALPKTSAWRQIKRLERLGYVKVTKIGAQNQIELAKQVDPTG